MDCTDMMFRNNHVETDSDAIVFSNQDSAHANLRNVVEGNYLTSRVGHGVHFTVSGSGTMSNHQGNIVRQNEFRLLTGTGQYSVYEDSPGASTSDPTVRYMNGRGYVGTIPTGIGTAGDVYWNHQQGLGRALGWVCVTTGSPGVWRPFAQIGAMAAVQSSLLPASGTTQNLNVGDTSYLRLSSDPGGNVTIGGMTGGYDGRVLVVQNNTTRTVTFNHNDTGSSSGNRIWNKDGVAVAIANGGAASFIYDAAAGNQVWIMVSRG